MVSELKCSTNRNITFFSGNLSSEIDYSGMVYPLKKHESLILQLDPYVKFFTMWLPLGELKYSQFPTLQKYGFTDFGVEDVVILRSSNPISVTPNVARNVPRNTFLKIKSLQKLVGTNNARKLINQKDTIIILYIGLDFDLNSSKNNSGKTSNVIVRPFGGAHQITLEESESIQLKEYMDLIWTGFSCKVTTDHCSNITVILEEDDGYPYQSDKFFDDLSSFQYLDELPLIQKKKQLPPSTSQLVRRPQFTVADLRNPNKIYPPSYKAPKAPPHKKLCLNTEDMITTDTFDEKSDIITIFPIIRGGRCTTKPIMGNCYLRESFISILDSQHSINIRALDDGKFKQEPGGIYISKHPAIKDNSVANVYVDFPVYREPTFGVLLIGNPISLVRDKENKYFLPVFMREAWVSSHIHTSSAFFDRFEKLFLLRDVTEEVTEALRNGVNITSSLFCYQIVEDVSNRNKNKSLGNVEC